jgi:hypothetical protein
MRDLLILVAKALVLNGYLRHPYHPPHPNTVHSFDLGAHPRKRFFFQFSLPTIPIQIKRRLRLDGSGLSAKSHLPLLINQHDHETLAMIEVALVDNTLHGFVPKDPYLGFNRTACLMTNPKCGLA